MDISAGIVISGAIFAVGIVITFILIGSREPDYSSFEDEDRSLD